jgi:carbon monoxide dehydrogenase subunit G
MKLEQSFEVDAPLEQVWSVLLDIERVTPCLPGAGVEGRNEDGSYAGAFNVKIGPTAASYSGKLAFENVDEATHTAVMQANGTDRRGQGGARATITSTLHADGQRTRVQVNTDYQITGRLARFGRGGMIEDIGERLLREFADNLQRLLATSGEHVAANDTSTPSSGAVAQSPEALDAGSMVASAAWQRARSSPLVPTVIVLLILVALRRRRSRS